MCLWTDLKLQSQLPEEWLSGKQYLDMCHIEPAEHTALGTIPSTETEEGKIAA